MSEQECRGAGREQSEVTVMVSRDVRGRSPQNTRRNGESCSLQSAPLNSPLISSSAARAAQSPLSGLSGPSIDNL